MLTEAARSALIYNCNHNGTKAPMEPYRQINLRIADHSRARLKAVCRQAGTSVSAVLRTLIDSHIAKAADDLAASNELLAGLDRRLHLLQQRDAIGSSTTLSASPFFGYVDAHED